MPLSPRSLRRLYLEWVEEQIEDYKNSIPRDAILDIADQVAERLRMNRRGQYQLTELLMSEEVDRTIFRMLKLPGYRTWSTRYLELSRRVPLLPERGTDEPVGEIEAVDGSPADQAPSDEPPASEALSPVPPPRRLAV